MPYKFGEDIDYSIDLLKFSDKDDIQSFSCGNEKLDFYIKSEIFSETELDLSDGLHFKVCISGTNKIIVFFSLANSGIIHQLDNYIHLLPAIKIDVFAIDKEFQKMHFNIESKESKNPDDHYYFSDQIMGEVVKHCRNVGETQTLVDYILIYADKKAHRFYQRNLFADYQPFMQREQSQEINALIPMYMQL